MWKLKLNIVLAHGHKHLTIVGFLFMVIFVHTASMRNVPLAADSPDVIEISLDNESNVKHSVPVNSKVVLKCDLANNSWFKDGTRLTVETKKPSQFKIERVKRIDDGIYECRSSRGIIRTVRFEVTSSSELTVSDSLDHGTKSVNKFFEDDNEQTDDQDSRSSDENNADDFNDNAEIDEEEDDDYNYYDDTETTKNLHEGFPRFLHVDNMFKQIKHFTGDKVRIKCKADGTPLPNITWTKDNEPINANRQARYGSWSVALSDLSVNDSGDYNCKVCNIHGCIDYSSKLIVRELQVKSHTSNLTNNDEDDEDKDALANKPSMPRFIKRSDMDEIVAKPSGNMVRIKCAATGNPLPNITWTKDNQNISRSMGVVKYGKWSIVLEDLIPKDTGEYKCLVCNEHGCIHHISKLQVRERFPSGPIIKENYPKNQTVLDGSDAMMECAYLGVDLTVYTQWVRNTINATDRGGVPKNATILKGNPDRPELLVLQNITYENEGWYTCIAANSLGQSVASAYLHVVDELSEDPIQAPIKPHSKWISIIAFGLGALFLVALGIMCFTFKRLKHEKLMKHRAMETVHQWTKKVIILKPSSDVSNPEAVVQIPIVKIEKQRTTLIQSSNCDAGPFNEYEFPLDSNWEFSRSQLSLGPTLGEGAFGRVIMAEAHGLVKNGMETIVAVKMVKEGHTDADMTSLVQEMEVMKMIGKHINIINLLGCCSQDGPLYVIVEYAPHGNLKDFLKKNRPTSEYEVGIADDKDRKNLTQKDLISFAFQVARGMEYLASRRCIHRDLAARNVLVSDDYVVKIADFGLARDIQESEYYRKNTNGRLPIKWMAPESLRDKFYDSQSDVWSYGVLLWEIMNYGEQPYPQVYSSEHLYEFLWAGNRMEKPQRCSYNIYMLMRQCWNFDPHERPTFTEIVENLDKILGATANEEYLDLGVPLLETPPSSDDESDAETLREHSPLRYNF